MLTSGVRMDQVAHAKRFLGVAGTAHDNSAEPKALIENLSSSIRAKMGIETPAYILGLLTSGGGITGYVRTGSVPSIVAGITVGSLYLLGGYRIQAKQPFGIELALLASIVLAGSSIPRAIRLGKPLPIGLSVLALYGLYTFGNAYRLKA
ncbi:hypothetical protein B7463_g267, partial [Scytalidium lignicola]